MGIGPDLRDPVEIVEMKGELRKAQLGLDYAQSAADRLSIRFTVEEIARCAQSDILVSVCTAASALQSYFFKIHKHSSSGAICNPEKSSELSEDDALVAIQEVCRYLRSQREHYRLNSEPLDRKYVAPMLRFFSPTLLAGVKVVQLETCSISEPTRWPESQAVGYKSLLEFTHMASATFEDILVFNDKITERLLFHALVRAVQFQVLGLERYTECFVRAFLRTRWRFNVPLEAHAFELESKFAANPKKFFPVEDEVRFRVGRHLY
jgi:hypothetical protein